ncbi:MAG: class I SAM-dependent methyltransferase [Alphaproteobacteria bacterium]
MATEISAEDAERLRNFEREGHDALAESYHDFFSPVTELANEPLLRAVRLEPGMRLLDVATGPGTLAAAAARRGAHPVGVDLAPKMIALARRLYPGIAFQEADIESLPFAAGTFDAVSCGFALGHIPRPEVSLAECVRVIKPGGRIAFSWWDDPSRQRIQGIFREALAEVRTTVPAGAPQGHNMFRFSDRAAFGGLLRDAGLTAVQVDDHATVFTFANADTVWFGGLGSFVLTGAMITSQNDTTQRAIRAAFDRLISGYATADGIALPVAFKVGSGRKPD